MCEREGVCEREGRVLERGVRERREGECEREMGRCTRGGSL